MTKFVVTIYGLNGKLLERIGGFTDRAEANKVAAKHFQRGDVYSVHVTKDVTTPAGQGNRRYR